MYPLSFVHLSILYYKDGSHHRLFGNCYTERHESDDTNGFFHDNEKIEKDGTIKLYNIIKIKENNISDKEGNNIPIKTNNKLDKIKIKMDIVFITESYNEKTYHFEVLYTNIEIIKNNNVNNITVKECHMGTGEENPIQTSGIIFEFNAEERDQRRIKKAIGKEDK